MKQSCRLVKIASPVHCIVSEVLFCLTLNCLDIILVCVIVKYLAPTIHFSISPLLQTCVLPLPQKLFGPQRVLKT